MRIYLPLLFHELQADLISPRIVHAATPALGKLYPDYDSEELEVVASLAAADECLNLARQTQQKLPKDFHRIVAVAEVANSVLQIPAKDRELLPTALLLQAEITWDLVESFLVDEPGSEELAIRAISGDQEAYLALEDVELLWFDAIERNLIK
ncbi:MAG: hypothetical protein SPG61_04875 [Arcanobacterium sp.]|nr:hypothetical protein [Arcanobacterium sp.]